MLQQLTNLQDKLTMYFVFQNLIIPQFCQRQKAHRPVRHSFHFSRYLASVTIPSVYVVHTSGSQYFKNCWAIQMDFENYNNSVAVTPKCTKLFQNPTEYTNINQIF